MHDHIIALILQYKYPLLLLVSIVEGPIISMACGFLLKLGQIAFIPTYFILMSGDLIGDVFWYSLGYFGGMPGVRKFGKFFGITEESVATVKRIFHRHHIWILFISKITMGFGFFFVTLFTAGLTRLSFKRYMLLNFFGQFIWTAILLGVGYFFGNAYTSINGIIGKVSLVAALLVLIFAAARFGKYLRNRNLHKYSS